MTAAPLVSIVIPFHDHAHTLALAVESCRRQTWPELEVLVVADGSPPAAARAAAALCQADPRLRLLEFEKGAHHGEDNRHRALSAVRGEIVCYLDDEDLLLPWHAAEMVRLLADTDFVHTAPVRAEVDGGLGAYVADVEDARCRALMRRGVNQIPLSCGAHRMAAYRRLERGWTVAPPGIASDLWLWLAFLDLPRCRWRRGGRPSVLHFPRWPRRDWTRERRRDELLRWQDALADGGRLAAIDAAAVRAAAIAAGGRALDLPAWAWHGGRRLLRHRSGGFWRALAEPVLGPLPR